MYLSELNKGTPRFVAESRKNHTKSSKIFRALMNQIQVPTMLVFPNFLQNSEPKCRKKKKDGRRIVSMRFKML